MNEILRHITESEGSCCIWRFLAENKGSTRKLAARLGVCAGTIQYWRTKIALGDCRCLATPNCQRRR